MQHTDRSVITTEAVVIGAGYSGLAAALRLTDLGIDVTVLEASPRVGGRIWSERRTGQTPIDHGGQWAGPTQKYLLSLAQRFGCNVFETFDSGDHLEIWQDGSKAPYRGDGPASGAGVDEYQRIVDQLDTMAHTVDLAEPWHTADFVEWDAQSVRDFFLAQTDDAAAHARLDLFVQGLWCAEPQEISLFHLVFYIAAAGGYNQLMDTAGGAQELRFVEGAAGPAEAVAKLLGRRIRLGEPVLGIEYTDAGVTVRTSALDVHARLAVVALPPAALESIEFSPALPRSRRLWLAGNATGRVAKIHAFFPTPFWRADGLAGIATLYDAGPLGVIFDNSPADGATGALVGFVYGDRVDDWAAMASGARRAAVLDSLATVVGPQALSPTDYTEKNWAQDPYVHGGYEAFATPGAWSAHGRDGWREPTARLHWAGTETASEWNGYMDGAVSAGYRAADELAERLMIEAASRIAQ